jgi:hypothetical protein
LELFELGIVFFVDVGASRSEVHEDVDGFREAGEDLANRPQRFVVDARFYLDQVIIT